MPARTLWMGLHARLLDARPDRLDLRDLPYPPTLGHLAPRLPDDAAFGPLLQALADGGFVLDQGTEGACTGYGLAAVIHRLRLLAAGARGEAPPPRVSPAMLYRLARLYDEWPGEDYEGSSCRGALKGWHRHGVCREALWTTHAVEDPARRDEEAANWDLDALGCTLGVYYRVETGSVVNLQAALRDTGAVYVCSTVHEGWNVPPVALARRWAELPTVTHMPEPRQPGVHAYALIGYDEGGFLVQNSWGARWGAGGFARLPYEAWIAHGEDAWVFTLGVPRRAADARSEPVRSARHRAMAVPPGTGTTRATASGPMPGSPSGGWSGVSSGMSSGAPSRALATLGPHRGEPAPLSTDAACGHAVVLDRGFAVQRDLTAANAAEDVARTVCERPLAWLRAQRTRKLLVYVHGGLNGEGAAIDRARRLAPHALAHGIYPLFVAWRTGPLETLSDVVEEAFARATGNGREAAGPGQAGRRGGAPAWHAMLQRLSERTDRLLETLLQLPGGALWAQMKLNAERASVHAEGGMRAVVAQLAALHRQLDGGLELHLAGHSAGALVIGALLTPLAEAGLRVRTLRLLAPACSVGFALGHYAPALRAGVLEPRHFHLHVLSHANELRDAVGPYRKSLLMLVSRALEPQHKTPLLGLHAAFDAGTARPEAADGMWSRRGAQDVAEWLDFWHGLGTQATNLHVLHARTVSTGAGRISADHGCFDNAVDVMGTLLGAVRAPDQPERVRIRRLDA
ncbi:MAG: hypothetical protein RI988_2614 [Pseudomonadota bacterium]|jgi:hypothetical protein